jgi:hypothetical protein
MNVETMLQVTGLESGFKKPKLSTFFETQKNRELFLVFFPVWIVFCHWAIINEKHNVLNLISLRHHSQCIRILCSVDLLLKFESQFNVKSLNSKKKTFFVKSLGIFSIPGSE